MGNGLRSRVHGGVAPKVVLGTMTFGTGSGGRINDAEEIKSILQVYNEKGGEELDTARMYCDGNTEELLGQILPSLPYQFKVATKSCPSQPGDFQPSKLREQFAASLTALQSQCVDIFYLHWPDYETPLEETLKAVNELYKEGKFRELGLSNYAAWEVHKIHCICKSNGYVLPTVYQGMYNALTRGVEDELLVCLRDLDIRFYAYNPLCGGLLSGHYKFEEDPAEGRFSPLHTQGDRYRQRYWSSAYFEAVEGIKQECGDYHLKTWEAALKWLVHHSKLRGDLGDAIIIGGSSLEHVRQNLEACEKGPLPVTVVDALHTAWERTKSVAPSYHRGVGVRRKQ
ncbi:Aflatoxin B1 aldehyde reductase member 3 [Gaertneriomyces sp. JEL0708]|nr:Aflatoxin B1 aldehyde reductase member 3 [Gaertneriomyces sp. JEL0708]